MAITAQYSITVMFHCGILCFWKFDIKLFQRYKYKFITQTIYCTFTLLF